MTLVSSMLLYCDLGSPYPHESTFPYQFAFIKKKIECHAPKMPGLHWDWGESISVVSGT